MSILQQVVEYCVALLDKAKSYLDYRGISLETAVQLQLGYFPFHFSSLLKSIKDPRILRDRGLVYDATHSGFSGRLIFPLRDWRGKLVAITGRKASPRTKGPKYFNTIFNKSEMLYNLDSAIEEILRTRRVIVVEGQMDVVRCREHNVQNVVSVCGNTLTPWQVMLLARYSRVITIIFDNDTAGIEASQKVLKRYSEIPGLTFEAFIPPAGKDLDEFGRKVSASIFREWLEDPLNCYKLL